MIKYHTDLIQGSDEWRAARCGLLTASEMKHIITPAKLQYAQNDKERAHLYELLAQRITQYVEPAYISDDMLRGQSEESYGRETYHEKYEPVAMCGFITNDRWGFTLGCSPDGLVGEEGGIEVKSRRAKYHIETILNDAMPDEFKIQVQASMLISERKWWDFISYCGGMPMYVKRIDADKILQDAIVEAARIFHKKMNELSIRYHHKMADTNARLTPTERRIEEEIMI